MGTMTSYAELRKFAAMIHEYVFLRVPFGKKFMRLSIDGINSLVDETAS